MNAEEGELSGGKKTRKAAAPKFTSLRAAGLENFTVEEMARERLTAAKYNPRKISESEREKLQTALKRHGLVAPVVWNKQTGNLVGGHQRISIMDQLMNSKDYTLQVSVIDVDARKEKEINVLLNNTQAMGTFDLNLLKEVFTDEEVSLAGAGYTQQDMINMFGVQMLESREKDLVEFSTYIAGMFDQYNAISAANEKKAKGENYLVFVFPASSAIDALIAQEKWPEYRYQNGVALLTKFGIAIPPPEKS